MGNVFAAVLPPREVVTAVMRVQRELKRYVSGARWVDPRFYHLTLHFYGRVRVEDALRDFETRRFPTHFQSCGLSAYPFPRSSFVRVVHYGFTDEYGKEQHLTLARFAQRTLRVEEYERIIRRIHADVPSFTVERIFLLESLFTEGKREYVTHATRSVEYSS